MKPEKLKELIRRHGPALQLFAAQWTRSSEDCVQESFIELSRRETEPENIAAWLFSVVRNRAIHSLRRESRRMHREAEYASRQARWFEPAADNLDADEIQKALQRLPTELNEIVVMRIWGELDFATIARITGSSTSTVHRQFHRAIQKLKDGFVKPIAPSSPGNPSFSNDR